MNATKHLERRALDAHRAGDTWAEFWHQHGGTVANAEPYHRNAYHALVRRLLALVVSGDDCGMEPIGSAMQPWERDDAAKPADVGTRARLLVDSIPGMALASTMEPTR